MELSLEVARPLVVAGLGRDYFCWIFLLNGSRDALGREDVGPLLFSCLGGN